MLALVLAATGDLFAQRPGAQRPAPANPGEVPDEVPIDDVCAAAVPRDAQGSQFQWRPDSAALAYFKPLPSGFGLRLELDMVDAAGGARTVLLDQRQIDKLFPAKPVGSERTMVPPPRAAVGFQWSPNGDGLLLHSDTSIVWLDRKTLQTRILIAGDAPIGDVQLSPNGRWAAFVRDHNVWAVSLGAVAVRAVTTGRVETLRKGELDWLYPSELGAKHGYIWSPDSSRIAYLEFNLKGVASYTPPFADEDYPAGTIDYPTPGTRNPRVRILLAAIDGKSPPVLINTGKESDVYLPRLQWLPDGRQIAVERLNRAQTRLDLLLANARTGASRVALTDTDQYWINLTDTLYFLKGSPRFIWSSERSGYRHLYLYRLDGKLARQLTDGPWEVSSLDAVDERAGKFYYTSTEKSALEAHIYVAALDGVGPDSVKVMRISGDSGTHEALFSPDSSTYVDTFSTAVKPWARGVYRVPKEDSSPRADLSPPSQANASAASTKLFVLDEPSPGARKPAFRPVDFLTVKTHDGIEMNGLMLRPPGFSPAKKYPAIVYIDGGPGRQAVRDGWDGDVSMWRQLLAQRGYVVFAVDNRGSSGRGHLFEEYVHLRFRSQEMIDQRDAFHYLQSLPYIDPARIGIWGRGFGGGLAVDAMLHPPLLFKAGFAIAPVVDWMRYDSAFAERYLGDPVKNQDGYLSSSPLDEWQRYKGPMLVAQGTADLEVHPDQTMELEQDLVEKRKYVEIALYPGESHAIDQPDACVVMYQRATDFFSKALSPN